MPEWTGRKLSDGFVQSVKLRASGADAFVQPPDQRSVSRFPERTASSLKPYASSFPASAADALQPLADMALSASQGMARSYIHTQHQQASDSSMPSDSTLALHLDERRKRIRAKTERRREQCRANQARYRNKQRMLRMDLEASVVRLREEVADLEAKRVRLTSTPCAKQTPWTIVAEYFRLFRHGASILSTRKSQGSSATASASQQDARSAPRWELMMQTEVGQEQLEFLRSSIADEAEVIGSGDGTHSVEALANQWVFWTQSFDELEFKLDRIETTETSTFTIAATLRVCATMSDSTVRGLFPHLLSRGSAANEDHSSDANLAWKLCGQPIDMKCMILFECAPMSGRVRRIQTQLDVVPAMQRVLGSLADAARVLDGSCLTAEGLIAPSC